jgi:hypothetical protein
MKKRYVWSLAALVVATTAIVTWSGNAQAEVVHAAQAKAAYPAAMPASLEGIPRETLAQCMTYWDPATHMSKVEWRRACQRTSEGTRF